ncbi:MAG: pilus assembly protein TadG-related protein [Actinomycetota bacterium]|nr:pilus assembly protein TadG-related protein [Actinomycetota bacterium]MDD5667973.1 pilus assembly protein TadG-related protein [Actinomycetota bacterium]
MRRALLSDERAGVTLVAAALMAVMLLVGVVLHDVAAIYGTRGRAQTAADAAAKAAGLELTPYFGVGSDPHGAAREYAARNGAELLECTCGAGGRYVWVTVRVSMGAHLLLVGGRRAKVTATARCYLDPAPGATESSTTSTLSI